MKYALIGCGRIATNHIKAVLNNHLELSAVCDVKPEAMEALLAKHGLKSRAKVISGLNLPMVVEAVLRDMDVCSADELSGLVQAARDSIVCMDLTAQAAGSDDE